MLLRLTSMRGVNLDLFDFDYDLTWSGFFLGADERVYGRYGGRDAEDADNRVSLAGLKHAMQAALVAHRLPKLRGESSRPAGRPAGLEDSPRGLRGLTVEQLPAARRLKETSCIHCHHVYDFRHEARQANGTWSKDELWVYPLPENVGITLEVDRGNRVLRVRKDSAVDKAGLRAADALIKVNGLSVASFADIQYALHRAPARGEVAVTWQRDGKTMTARLELRDGWRQTDLSWRWSLRGVGPSPGLHGDDLPAAEKKSLGLDVKRLAFRQANFLSEAARQAGIRQNDIIVGIDGQKLEMTARQFSAYVRLNHQVGDRVTVNLIRDGKPLDVPMVLAARAPF